MATDRLELVLAWQRHLGTGAVADTWFERVLARHREPWRHYHTDRHVAWVLRHLESFARRGLVDDEGAVAAAGFFHDLVYEPRRHDNERASADVARTGLAELGWPPERVERVAAMIEATEHHRLDDADRDTAALLAADLAVLAAEPARYADYVRAVRREYAHVDDEGWTAGRSAVLQTLLGRPQLYASHLGLDDWERRARANIAAELATLATPGGRPDQ